jgi:hypothetical protein
MTVTVLILFVFFNLILDAPRKWQQWRLVAVMANQHEKQNSSNDRQKKEVSGHQNTLKIS